MSWKYQVAFLINKLKDRIVIRDKYRYMVIKMYNDLLLPDRYGAGIPVPFESRILMILLSSTGCKYLKTFLYLCRMKSNILYRNYYACFR